MFVFTALLLFAVGAMMLTRAKAMPTGRRTTLALRLAALTLMVLGAALIIELIAGGIELPLG